MPPQYNAQIQQPASAADPMMQYGSTGLAGVPYNPSQAMAPLTSSGTGWMMPQSDTGTTPTQAYAGAYGVESTLAQQAAYQQAATNLQYSSLADQMALVPQQQALANQSLTSNY